LIPLKIRLAKSAGFCFGVRRALDLALKTARAHAPVCMLGDIVHNEHVIAMIKKTGIKKVSALRNGRGKTLLIRAHGASRKIIEDARRHGYDIVDATCPMVKEIHKITKAAEKNGYPVIIIGDKKHDEVRGIIGQLKNRALVIDDIARIPKARVKKLRKAAIVVQSTQNAAKVKAIIAALQDYIGDLKFHNTICGPTRIKQSEIKSMPLENDVMIIIGSKTSANTRRLYEIAKELNPSSHWIQSKKNIRRNWFQGALSVGVTAGASTPQETTRDVIGYLKSLP
jgi:4-hydroxy-3-methylbut-2-enyl diphosphate reductase